MTDVTKQTCLTYQLDITRLSSVASTPLTQPVTLPSLSMFKIKVSSV